MLNHEAAFHFLGVIVVTAPALLVVVLGLYALWGRRFPERIIGALVQTAVCVGLFAAVTILVLMLLWDTRHVVIPMGEWVHVESHQERYEEHYHFVVKFVFDRLSVPFLILSFVLCGTIGAFANRYMHREPGFSRFFVLYSFFVLGMVITSLAGTIETLFAGWELVGLSSALLVAFYQERLGPVRNGLRVWIVYRISDAALLLASIVMHHLRSGGDLDMLLGTGVDTPWPLGSPSSISEGHAVIVGLLLLLAAAGKSALIPFCGWLPRAMEGPTPSSAVFYGALSVHLGAFLLLRVSALIALSFWLCGAVILTGVLTAMFASFAGRVQTDIKSALSFASLTQVGIIVAEIGVAAAIGGGIGNTLRYIALVHLLGHACFRTLQFIRAPNVLLDYSMIENAIGNRLPRFAPTETRFVSPTWQSWLYRWALEKGYLDAVLSDYIVYPLLAGLRWCDAMERRWTDFLTGTSSRESDAAKSTAGSVEDLL